MHGIVLKESGGADSRTSICSLIILPFIFVFLQPMDITLDEKHLTGSIVLPDIEDGWCLESLNISARL